MWMRVWGVTIWWSNDTQSSNSNLINNSCKIKNDLLYLKIVWPSRDFLAKGSLLWLIGKDTVFCSTGRRYSLATTLDPSLALYLAHLIYRNFDVSVRIFSHFIFYPFDFEHITMIQMFFPTQKAYSSGGYKHMISLVPQTWSPKQWKKKILGMHIQLTPCAGCQVSDFLASAKKY